MVVSDLVDAHQLRQSLFSSVSPCLPICAAGSGHIIVVRDYRTVFASAEAEIPGVLRAHSIIFDLRQRVELLSTHGDQAVFVTVSFCVSSHRRITFAVSTVPHYHVCPSFPAGIYPR